jgi:hypothetical protein
VEFGQQRRDERGHQVWQRGQADQPGLGAALVAQLGLQVVHGLRDVARMAQQRLPHGGDGDALAAALEQRGAGIGLEPRQRLGQG